MNKIAKICAIGGLVLAVGGGTAYGISYGSKVSDTVTYTDPPSAILAMTGKQTEETEIILSDSGITVNGDGASVSGSKVTITQAGRYSVSGTLTDGQIYVNADDGYVILILDGADISNSSDAAIYIENADTFIELAEETANRLQSGTEIDISAGAEDSEASGGTIHAKDDLYITGTGSLQVFGYINNGVQSSNNISIDGGKIEVTALNNGIKGKDSVTIYDGDISVRSGGDGIKSDDTTGEGYGVINICGGNVSIESDGDGIQAETDIEISSGEFSDTSISIISGGGSESAPASGNGGDRGLGGFDGDGEPPAMPDNGDFNGKGGKGGFKNFGGGDTPPEMPENGGFGGKDGFKSFGGDGENPPSMPENVSFNPDNNDWGGFEGFGDGGFRGESFDMDDSSATSTKGIKCGGSIKISGGNISIDSYDDAIHSNDSITITGGTFELASGDDGIHADNELTVEDGTITVTRSYEGLEANQIHLNGGTIDVTASDDGVNAYGGQNNFGGWGGSSKTTEETPMLYFSGANVTVNANGDGIDSNGSIFVEAGTIIVNGPVNSMNGAIDSGSENGGKCIITGGTILAIGAAGMDEGFSDGSSQCSFRIRPGTAISAGSEIKISDVDGNVLFSHTAIKNASSVVFSSPDLKQGEKYILSIDGEETEIEQSSVSVGGSSGFDGGGFGRNRR
ncbi:MAG: carbohydrate-binding domain-containing protein [Oscillospiraceae bacterium]|nr:carbohydrate-binding domain-containing protein [Oscillospiraceae bacterium]